MDNALCFHREISFSPFGLYLCAEPPGNAPTRHKANRSKKLRNQKIKLLIIFPKPQNVVGSPPGRFQLLVFETVVCLNICTSTGSNQGLAAQVVPTTAASLGVDRPGRVRTAFRCFCEFRGLLGIPPWLIQEAKSGRGPAGPLRRVCYDYLFFSRNSPRPLLNVQGALVGEHFLGSGSWLL